MEHYTRAIDFIIDAMNNGYWIHRKDNVIIAEKQDPATGTFSEVARHIIPGTVS